MITVKATREGLVGHVTASGWKIDTEYPFVALPSKKALGKWVVVRNPLNGKQGLAQVRDIGPWNTDDDLYVFNEARPLSEEGIAQGIKHPTKGAGIDLGERVWNLLGMTDNGNVEWEFFDGLADEIDKDRKTSEPNPISH